LQATAPVPIIVLNPTCQHSFQIDGSSTVQIVGGPTRSVQVNSSDTSCAAATTKASSGCNSTGPTIDLSQGGPKFTGSEFAVVGAPTTPPNGFAPGSTGDWGKGAPISDPYALVAKPDIPPLSPTNGVVGSGKTAPLSVIYKQDGCPDNKNCDEYLPGRYTNPIVVTGATAIFVPGIYYMVPDSPDMENSGEPGTNCIDKPTGKSRAAFAVDSNGVVRPASNSAAPVGFPGANDGSNGVMFYLSGSGGAGTYSSIFFGSNAGKAPGGHTVDPYDTSLATCPGGDPPPKELKLPASVDGNVLVGQCTKKGTYINNTASTDTTGGIRGLIFFQDRANADANGQASMQGGGGLVLSGNMYFHNCNASGTGTGCSAPRTGYNAFFQLQGSPGNTSYVLGNITTDELIMGGGGTTAMSLNPNAIYSILKATLLR
jgi:hypothetical protein